LNKSWGGDTKTNRCERRISPFFTMPHGKFCSSFGDFKLLLPMNTLRAAAIIIIPSIKKPQRRHARALRH
jgi:hypothetical protein